MVIEQALQTPISNGAFEQIDGLDIFVRRSNPEATDVDVVMIHGLGGTSANWTDLMHLQAERGRTVAALDLPGFGRSEPEPGGDYSLARHAGIVIEFLDSLPTPVHLVGNSLGGAVVTVVAAERPDLVATLTLLAPALPHVKFGVEKLPILLGLAPKAAELLEWARGNQSPTDRVNETMKLVFGDPGRINPLRHAEAVQEQTLRHGLPHVWHAFVGSSRGLGRGFLPWRRDYLWKRLDEVQAPVLGLFGTQDRLVDPSIAGRVAHTISGGTVVVMPGIGHCPQMEVPIATDRLLDAHILGQL
ncbi:MAG: alpha/beta fold hydrolase [Actinobacteria bacterium]|nr:alpha/beta fold hydrolase [Actinomycetota bacterium]